MDDVNGNESGPVETPSQPEQTLDEWANQPAEEGEEEQVAKPVQAKVRKPDGKFGKMGKDQREVADALKDTLKPGPGQEEEEEEEEVEEPVEEKPKQSRKVKAVIDGKETLVDIDDEAFSKLNAVQMMQSSQKAWREAAEMRKEAQALKQALEVARENITKDPMSLFRALGVDESKVFEFAQQKALEKVYETIDPNTGQPYTPEQQKIIQLQKELQAKQAQENEFKTKAEQEQFEKMKEVIRQDLDRKFTTALNDTGLPPTPYTMMRLANLMEQFGPDMDPAQVAPMVLEDVVTEIVHTINTVPVETAIDLLGPDFMKALRKYDIEQARSKKDKFGNRTQKLPGNASLRQPGRGKSTTNPDEAADYLEKWANS